jgi:YHS domain-containing protein
MKVDTTKALTAQHDARTHYFCSERCLNQFEAEPTSKVMTPHHDGRAAAHSHGHWRQRITDPRRWRSTPTTAPALAREIAETAHGSSAARAVLVAGSSRSTRLSSTALVATMIELADISSADHSGRSSMPAEGKSTPAAIGMASTL